MGRAAKNPREKKSVRLQVMATQEEARRLRRAAKKTGTSVSAWLLQVALEAAEEAEQASD